MASTKDKGVHFKEEEDTKPTAAGALTPPSKQPPHTPPDHSLKGPPTKGKPTPPTYDDTYYPQADINKHDTQYGYFNADQGATTAEEVMEHIIDRLLLECGYRGPIRSALSNNGCYEPHQLLLLEPAGLLTNRDRNRESIVDSIPLNQQTISSMLNLQAYVMKTLVKKTRAMLAITSLMHGNGC